MPITVDIPPELEERLQEEAEREGIATEELIGRFITAYLSALLYLIQSSHSSLQSYVQKLLPLPHTVAQKPYGAAASHAEWERRFDEWINSHDPNKPPLPENSTRRSFFYGDRG